VLSKLELKLFDIVHNALYLAAVIIARITSITCMAVVCITLCILVVHGRYRISLF
jgi:hypothetical protein